MKGKKFFSKEVEVDPPGLRFEDLLPFIFGSIPFSREALAAVVYQLPPEVYRVPGFDFVLHLLSKCEGEPVSGPQWRLAVYGSIAVFGWGFLRTGFNITRRILTEKKPDSPMSRLLWLVDEDFPILKRLFDDSQPEGPVSTNIPGDRSAMFTPNPLN